MKKIFLKKIFSKQSLKKFAMRFLWFITPLVVLASTIIILLSQNLDLSFDTYEKELDLIKNLACVAGFVLALTICLGDKTPKNYPWLSFCLGMSILFVGMYFHISIWILLAIVIGMVNLISYFFGSRFDGFLDWIFSIGIPAVLAFGLCAIFVNMGVETAELNEAARVYRKNPDSIPKTVIEDIQKSAIYTEEYGITSYSATEDNGMEDIQKGDTVQLWVVDGEVKTVLYNSRTKKFK